MQASHHNAEEHAIALVLGRLYLFVEVQGLPVRALHGFQTQLLLAGAPLGHRLATAGAQLSNLQLVPGRDNIGDVGL